VYFTTDWMTGMDDCAEIPFLKKMPAWFSVFFLSFLQERFIFRVRII